MVDSPCTASNVVNLFTGKTVSAESQYQITHLCPETRCTRMLYSNPRKPDRLIAIPILCWGLRLDGEVVGDGDELLLEHVLHGNSRGMRRLA